METSDALRTGVRGACAGLALAIALAGCEPAVEAPGPVMVPHAAVQTLPPPPKQQLLPPTAPPPPPAPPKPTFPPAKPPFIALARTGDPALDKLLAEGDRAFGADEFERAGNAYKVAFHTAPKRAAPLVGMARSTVARETPSLNFSAARGNLKIDGAMKSLRYAVKLEPDFGPAYAELGRTLLLLARAQDAIDPLERAVALLPQEPEAHSALGVALLASGRGADAIASLTRAVELDPGSAPRRGNLGTVLFMRGRIDDAIKQYQAQVQLDDTDARAHSDLGTALLSKNDFTGAMRELNRAVALDPRRATFRSNMGYALQLQGKMTEAIASYREAIRLDDKLASAWINLATALAKEPATRGEARAALERARALDPTDPRVRANVEELDALEKRLPVKP